MTREDFSVGRVMIPNPFRVRADEPIGNVIRLMQKHRIGAVPVLDGGSLVGIFTERDLIRHLADAGVGWREYPVSDWMTPKPHVIDAGMDWNDALALMERLQVRHLPIVQGERLIGIVSAGQLMSLRRAYLDRVVEVRTRELRRAYDQLLARDQEMQHYLRAAGRLQEQLVLPHQPPAWPEVSWGITFTPLHPLGGDFYDFTLLDETHLILVIADVSGHSLPAALVAILARTAFSEIASRSSSPGEILKTMNARLLGVTEDRFVSAFCGVIDRRTWRLTYANAGHPYPLLLRDGTRRTEPLSARGLLLGIMDSEVWRESDVELEPRDRVCLFTDGLIEAMNERGEAFGIERVAEVMERTGGDCTADINCLILRELHHFRGSRDLADDLTLVTLGLKSPC